MTDTNTDPFAQTTNEQVNYLDHAKSKFHTNEGELDIEGLARGKYESDKFISQLQLELAEARKKAEQGMAVKDLLEAIKSNPPGLVEPTPTPTVTDPTAATPTDISQLVKDTINQTAREQREAANKAAVVAKLNETFGGNAGNELGKKASELGISVARLEEIGKESPQALFNLLGLGTVVVPGSANVPTSRNALPSTGVGDRTKKYYDNLYRQNPNLRFDPKTTAQEHRDAIKLGERFFDN
jgi:hypothetical protein